MTDITVRGDGEKKVQGSFVVLYQIGVPNFPSENTYLSTIILATFYKVDWLR